MKKNKTKKKGLRVTRIGKVNDSFITTDPKKIALYKKLSEIDSSSIKTTVKEIYV